MSQFTEHRRTLETVTLKYNLVFSQFPVCIASRLCELVKKITVAVVHEALWNPTMLCVLLLLLLFFFLQTELYLNTTRQLDVSSQLVRLVGDKPTELFMFNM